MSALYLTFKKFNVRIYDVPLLQFINALIYMCSVLNKINKVRRNL